MVGGGSTPKTRSDLARTGLEGAYPADPSGKATSPSLAKPSVNLGHPLWLAFFNRSH